MATIAPAAGGPPLGDDAKSGHGPTWTAPEDSKTEPEETQGLLASLKSYPKGVFFMLGNEFCERFSFYGMRAILVMYFMQQHHFDASQAKTLYHSFVALAYLSPLIGSIAADNYFGRFRVILWVSLFYVLGHALLSVGALPFLDYYVQSTFDFSGLIIIALATGGIKPCVSAFAADQFNEHQHQQRAQFFSFFYFSINAGSLVAIALTPLLRGRVHCFGSEHCFPLAFGVPGVLMFAAFLIFLSGWRFYKITPAGKGNVVWKVVKCIGCALKGKIQAVMKKQDKAGHWVDYASPKYSDSLITGVKSLLAVSLLFVPVVFFWALFDQQGSTWVLQASQMDGRVGPFTILPDQMNTFNPLIILIMVPIFEAFIYPFTRRFVEITPLRKMAAGGVLAALAFVMAGFLQLKINSTLEPHPSAGKVFIQKFGDPSDMFLNGTSANATKLSNGKNEIDAGIWTFQDEKFDFSKKRSAFVFAVSGNRVISFPYALDKAPNGETQLILTSENGVHGNVVFVNGRDKAVTTPKNWTEIENGKVIFSIRPDIISSPEFIIYYGDGCDVANFEQTCKQKAFTAETGAVHVFYMAKDDANTELRQVVQGNTVSVLWQLPQFFVITLGEVLFSVTGLEFSYSQASPNMKSVLQAMWLLTTFAGNVVDMGISGARVFHEPAIEFFFYALLMFIVIGIFILIAVNYQYVDEEAMESETQSQEDQEQINKKSVDSQC
uniref:Uncharacterized protein n=1 Tax=Panagrolaimus sp. JU765 TaxID=591449 RepID=A0AC34Q9Q8_9BILA